MIQMAGCQKSKSSTSWPPIVNKCYRAIKRDRLGHITNSAYGPCMQIPMTSSSIKAGFPERTGCITGSSSFFHISRRLGATWIVRYALMCEYICFTAGALDCAGGGSGMLLITESSAEHCVVSSGSFDRSVYINSHCMKRPKWINLHDDAAKEFTAAAQ